MASCRCSANFKTSVDIRTFNIRTTGTNASLQSVSGHLVTVKETLLTIFALFVLRCATEAEDASAKPRHMDVAAKSHLDSTLEEVFIDSAKIGVQGQNKILARQVRYDDSICVNISLYKRDASGWRFQQSMHFQKDGVSTLQPNVSDYNGDQAGDFIFQCETAARGANVVMQLLIFEKDSFTVIKNSSHYPNLQYNIELKCIDAFLVYGGTNTVFLRLAGDSLTEFASVEVFDSTLTIEERDLNGTMKVTLKKRDAGYDNYTRFANYKPLKVAAEY
jgi:hypothetical protein